MSIAFIIVIALAVGLAIALFFQVKSGQRQADEQKKLLGTVKAPLSSRLYTVTVLAFQLIFT